MYLNPSVVTQTPVALSPMDAIATTPIPREHIHQHCTWTHMIGSIGSQKLANPGGHRCFCTDQPLCLPTWTGLQLLQTCWKFRLFPKSYGFLYILPIRFASTSRYISNHCKQEHFQVSEITVSWQQWIVRVTVWASASWSTFLSSCQ